jgi:hypothetical protein
MANEKKWRMANENAGRLKTPCISASNILFRKLNFRASILRHS